MKRDRFFNVALHEAFLAMRLRDLVTFRPSRFPFVKAETLGGIRRDTVGEFAKLEKLKPLGEDAVVVVNLLKEGTAEQRASDRAYALEMFGGMAEGVYGPMHIGSAVRVEGEAEYDRVALVYYPGIDFFRSMVESTFFNEIIGDKQLGDTMAMITVPLLDSL